MARGKGHPESTLASPWATARGSSVQTRALTPAACKLNASKGRAPAAASKTAPSSTPRSRSQASARAVSGVGIGSIWQRLRTVGKSASASAVVSTKRTPGEGSSSVLSRALAACTLSTSAGCKTTTLARPRELVFDAHSLHQRTSSMRIWRLAFLRGLSSSPLLAALAGLSSAINQPCCRRISSVTKSRRSGWDLACTKWQASQRPQAWRIAPPCPASHSQPCANTTAASSAPMSALPRKRRAWAR